jgi:glutamate-1-semialdehyde 2,1-aminomutase
MGSAAVQTAFRVARAKTGRQKFLRFEGHYHGWMDNVCWGFPPCADALGSRAASECISLEPGLPEHTGEEFIILPWNDLELLKTTLPKITTRLLQSSQNQSCAIMAASSGRRISSGHA